MKQRSFIILAAALAFLLIGAVAVYAYDSAHDHTIAKGVRAGGVDIGGMKDTAAEAKVRRELGTRLNRPLVVAFHGRRFKLTPAQMKLRLDAKGMVDDALHKSRDGNIFSRTVRGVFGGKVKADVAVAATYSHTAVDDLMKRVETGVDRPPRDASVDFSTGVLQKVKGQDGRQVQVAALRNDVESALALPNGDRRVPVPVNSTKPKVSTRQLAKKYGTIIAINRDSFTLTLYKHLKRVKSYTIAVGMQGLETPAGEYTVTDKQVDPSWHVPNSAWAGKLAGRVIPPGPADPLKARWIGITDGAGIHGTVETGSLGTAGSHGCIRMAIPDVIDLYDRTPYGSKIFIH